MLNEKLQQLGFTSADYSLSGEELVALPQTRMVEQIIQHDEVPATFDEQGVELTPEIPAWEEVVQVEETFYAELPSIDELKRLCVIDNDPTLLIGEFLKGKNVTDDDSLNVDLFVNGQGGWRFSQVQAPTWVELFSLIVPTKTKAEQEKINAEARAYLASTDWMVTRMAETGVPVPQDIAQARAEARARIV